MNYIALNQNILGKKLVIGSGFVGGNEKKPFLTEENFKIYLNGKHELPELTEINQHSPLGEITHPYAMSGMPSTSGLITYELLAGEESDREARAGRAELPRLLSVAGRRAVQGKEGLRICGRVFLRVPLQPVQARQSWQVHDRRWHG